jgi:maltose alpha-D-glucosyltransferase/alpha-amylase
MMDGDPLWFKDAVIYELHVRAFRDSNEDGVGDFRGVAEKLDHLEELGVTALWLLPFYPSPLRDDGYDIAEYTAVHSAYGTLADFKHLLREAHRRGIRVITELVLNHTSDQHPWFQRARRAPPDSIWRNFYVWSDSPKGYADARIIFKDFEASNWSWDPVAGAYYWHRFYFHQPDLNWDSPAVWRAMLRVLDFWLEMGVDGLRLDAVPYLYEREGTSCENLPETHATLKALRRHVDRKFHDRLLLAEANQWPEDAVSYFGKGDESHMAFHFPLMPRMFMALRMEDRYPIVDILGQTPAIPETCQWALFLRNHDELTLEMVTDEERDYMYRVYAHDPQARINLGIRRRLAPLLDNDRRRIELMNGLLLSLPGTPVLYYGDEIGMGDNIYLGDRNGVRTPMQWSGGRNAGFSEANPQRLYLPVVIDPDRSYEAVNVESQQGDPHSLLWWTKRLIGLRRRFTAFGRGSLDLLYPSNRKVVAFVRRFGDEQVLVVANLSRHAQFAELDLSGFRDTVPVEMFGGAYFPPVGERPYVLTLGPYSFYWFELRPTRAAYSPQGTTEAGELPHLALAQTWDDLFADGMPSSLAAVLPRFLGSQPWFVASGRTVKTTAVQDAIPVSYDSTVAHVVLVRVEYGEGDPETYLLLLAFATSERAKDALREFPQEIVAHASLAGTEGVIYTALRDAEFVRVIVQAARRRRRFRGQQGEIVVVPGPAYHRLWSEGDPAPRALPPRPARSHSCAFVDGRLVFKVLRRLEGGPNPDLEMAAVLGAPGGFPQTPAMAGHVEYRNARGESATVATLRAFVPNEGDAWQFSLDDAGRYFERVTSRRPRLGEAPRLDQPLLELSAGDAPPLARDLVGAYLEVVRLLGQRTGELHLALGSHPENQSFAPEPFTPFYQRSLFQSMRNTTRNVFEALRRRLPDLPVQAHAHAETALSLQSDILNCFRTVLDRHLSALRLRVHGNYHLGRVLWTGRDFVVIDFQGDHARSLPARRLKQSPLADVAAMLQSFQLVAQQALARHLAQGGGKTLVTTSDLEPWVHFWALSVSSAFLRAYLRTVDHPPFLPTNRDDLQGLLSIYRLQRAIEALGHEVSDRPETVRLPLQTVIRLVMLEARASPSDRESSS